MNKNKFENVDKTAFCIGLNILMKQNFPTP